MTFLLYMLQYTHKNRELGPSSQQEGGVLVRKSPLGRLSTLRKRVKRAQNGQLPPSRGGWFVVLQGGVPFLDATQEGAIRKAAK